MRLLIVRHGQTKSNVKKFIQGQNPGKLTKKGKKQTEKLAKRLLKEKIDIIYCSDLKRCKETIKPFLKLRKIPIIYTKELRERNYGIFSGKPISYFYKWLKERGGKGNFNLKIPKGESFPDVQKRAKKFISKIIKKHKEENILLVTHGALKTAIMLYLFNKTPEKHYKKYKGKNTALSIVYIKDNGKHRARVINSLKHLE